MWTEPTIQQRSGKQGTVAAVTPEVDSKQLRVDCDKPVFRASNDTNRSLHYGSAAFTGQQQRAAQQDYSEASRITQENRT